MAKQKVIQKRRIKALALPKSLRIKIAKYKQANPEVKYWAVAETFGCTYEQARHSCLQYQAGELTGRKPRYTKRKAVADIVKEKDVDSIMKQQLHYCLGQLDTDKNMMVAERVPLLDKLISARKNIQHIEIEGHMNRTDADVVIAIIRRFMPNASTDEAIKIIREETERCKILAVSK